jgi:hypothetical protein
MYSITLYCELVEGFILNSCSHYYSFCPKCPDCLDPVKIKNGHTLTRCIVRELEGKVRGKGGEEVGVVENGEKETVG